MKGFDNSEKASMMTLELLVGLSRYKDSISDKRVEENDNGVNVYSPLYCTTTHGINLKTLDMLQNLGLIQITKKESCNKSTLLLAEKLWFGNIKGVRDILSARIRNDKEKLSEYRIPLENIEFRLTDKKVDFEDMYSKINKLKECESKTEQVALNRFRTIFAKKRGLLDKHGICVEKDATGRDVIKRGKKENEYGNRIEEKYELGEYKREDQRTEFIEGLRNKGNYSGDIFIDENEFQIETENEHEL